MSLSHAEVRKLVVESYQKFYTDEPVTAVAQAEQGVAWLETSYGAGWTGEGKGSNNMGAIQSGKPPCNQSTSFLYTDTNPTDSGASIPYQICFRRYPTPQDGMNDLCRVMFKERPGVLAAAKTGDLYAVSKALYESHYYTGFGATPEIRIAHHYRALRSAVNRAAAALGEKMPDGFDPLIKVLKWSWASPFPTRTPDVPRVQRVVGVDDDGWYGRKTSNAVRAFQVAHKGLEPDGIVGLDTWHVIQEVERAMENKKLAA